MPRFESWTSSVVQRVLGQGMLALCTTRMRTQKLTLSALLPDRLGEVLPNLQQLQVEGCALQATAANTLLGAGFRRLQHVELRRLAGDKRAWQAHLPQLAGLSSLSSVSLQDNSCPTLFLGTLSTRLTSLHLDQRYRHVQPNTHSPAASWLATLQHVARCTRLESLTIPCVIGEELGLVAPALGQLRRLHLNSLGALQGPVVGDAVVEQLLRLPHLTSLHWDNARKHRLQQSYASQPCAWRELIFGVATPHLLARLPLHSLISPVRWDRLVVDELASVAEVQAAATNVATRCQAGWAWAQSPAHTLALWFIQAGHATFVRGATEGDTPAALLRAMGPLLAGLQELGISYVTWDVELSRALGEVLPRTCTELHFENGSFTRATALVELASSAPWLQSLHLNQVEVQPMAVALFVAAAKGWADARALGGPQLMRLLVLAQRGGQRDDWGEAGEMVRALHPALQFAVDDRLCLSRLCLSSVSGDLSGPD